MGWPLAPVIISSEVYILKQQFVFFRLREYLLSLRRVQLPGYEDRLPNGLSGGQKVGICVSARFQLRIIGYEHRQQ